MPSMDNHNHLENINAGSMAVANTSRAMGRGSCSISMSSARRATRVVAVAALMSKSVLNSNEAAQ